MIFIHLIFNLFFGLYFLRVLLFVLSCIHGWRPLGVSLMNLILIKKMRNQEKKMHVHENLFFIKWK